MKPTDVLTAEHRVIEVVLRALDKLAAQSELENKINQKIAADIIDFLKNFADKCHHAKEEDHLFPLMAQKGFPKEHGPVAVMLYEHEQGRALIQQMAEGLKNYAKDPKNIGVFIQAARVYVALLQQHIMKEDYHLFPMAESVFDESDRKNLLMKFEKVEMVEIGQDTHNKYHAMAEDLAKVFDIQPKEPGVTRAGPCGSCH